MQIWVDADACPVAIKQIIFRAANRWQIITTLIANQPLQTPPSPYISSRQVQQGFDVADNEIVRLCQAGDIVITSDIPLADEVISKGAAAISTRGEVYDQQNIKAKLGMRDFMDTMRASGAVTGGPPPLSASDRQQFANQLDKRLAKAKR